MQVKTREVPEDPTKLIQVFQKLTVIFNLTWGDLHIFLPTSCIPEQKQWICTKTQTYAKSLALQQPN